MPASHRDKIRFKEDDSCKNVNWYAESMKRKWIRWTIWVLLTPLMLFVLLMMLLYVPPVQNFLRKQAIAIVSEATGMEIDVERIDLRFPLNLLVRDVLVVQPMDSAGIGQQPDTLLRLESLNMHIQAWPLLKGHVEIDGIRLRGVDVNSANLLDGMSVQGSLGEFALESHYVDLPSEAADINLVTLNDTRLNVTLTDTTQAAPDTTVSQPVNWKFRLHRLKVDDVSVGLDMPLDSMRLTATLSHVALDDATIDLKEQLYAWRQFALQGTTFTYDMGNGEPAEGFDASHIAVRDLRLGIDSVLMHGRELHASIREGSLNERSGLSLTTLKGELTADSVQICIPSLRLSTPHSEINLTAQTYWQLVDMPTTGQLTAGLHAYIGKQDVMLFAGGLPRTFKEAYPFRPLTIRAGTVGNLRQMQLSAFNIDLPGAFALKGSGEAWNMADSLARNGRLDFDMRTGDLNFLAGLTGLTPDGSLVVPDSMHLTAGVRLDGPKCKAALRLRERQGTLDLNADYNASNDAYQATLAVDSLQLHHFLPKDSLYLLSTTFTAEGKGFDFTSLTTQAKAHLQLDGLQYGSWDINNIGLDASLKNGKADVRLNSDNSLLTLQALAEMRLNRPHLDGSINLNVEQVNLQQLNITPQMPAHPFAFQLDAAVRQDSIGLQLNAGDLNLRFRSGDNLEQLMARSEKFVQTVATQLNERKLDHAALRRLLPSAGLYLQAGQNNPLSEALALQNIRYDSLRVGFAITPRIGINGRSAISGLRMDSLRLDTIFFAVHQDTTRMRLQGGVINGPANPQIVFKSTLTGEIRNEDAELTLNYTDKQGRTGILFGINARPLIEGHGRGNGLLLQFIPDKPVIAYRQFGFADKHDKVYLHKNMHVYANVDMRGDDGIRFRMQSDPRDTVSLQNIEVELNRFKLSELTSVMPYLPRITGLLSAKAHYIQADSTLQVSANTRVDSLTYEGQAVGNIGVDGAWLPEKGNSHHLDVNCLVNNESVLAATGLLAQDGESSTMDIDTRIIQLPLALVNAFIPDQSIHLRGYANGGLNISGSMDVPRMQGQLMLDSAAVSLRQFGARFWFDNKPLRFENNKIVFDKYAIYTTSDNPFTIDGNIDLGDLNRMTTDLTLNARNYTLLDARRTRESMVYGKVCVDLVASIRGALDALMMRGNMNLLGTTDVTYVLTDSPLTVENRLEGLVKFTSFADTTTTEEEVPTLSLEGLDMLMTVHIDDAVRLRADLSPDRSKFVELEGGGDLSLQYTPQGDMSLNGRYTLTGGIMKYSLPIIPLKEFHFTSGSYVDWRGDLMNPNLDLKATERMRASVSDGDNGSTRNVNFDVSIAIRDRLSAPELIFDISAPDDATVENELQAMGAEERSKRAIAMLATGIYLDSSMKGGGFDMGSALNSVLQNQINALAGSALESVNASISVGVEDRTAAETGDKQTDYSFRYSQRFFNDRIQIVIGGKVSTGANATNSVESFIDNISVEYRLDSSSTRYIRVFHDKNYDSVLDGEVTETGVGLVLRRKMDRLSELFIFKKK